MQWFLCLFLWTCVQFKPTMLLAERSLLSGSLTNQPDMLANCGSNVESNVIHTNNCYSSISPGLFPERLLSIWKRSCLQQWCNCACCLRNVWQWQYWCSLGLWKKSFDRQILPPTPSKVSSDYVSSKTGVGDFYCSTIAFGGYLDGPQDDYIGATWVFPANLASISVLQVDKERA